MSRKVENYKAYKYNWNYAKRFKNYIEEGSESEIGYRERGEGARERQTDRKEKE